MIRIVKMTFRTAAIQEFKSIFKESKPKIEAMDGCLSVILLQDIHRPEIFFTYSDWKTESHLHLYRQSELFNETWKKTKALFGKKPRAWSVDEID